MSQVQEQDAQLIQQLNDKGIWNVTVPKRASSGKAWLTTDAILQSNICAIHKHLRRNYLYILVITGPPSEGKSTLAQQIGNDLDANFTIDDICIDASEFNKRFYICPEYSCVIFDEGILGMFSRDAMNVGNRSLAKALMVARAKVKSLVIFCTPDYLSMDTTIREKLVNGLIVVPKRGEFHFYSGKAAKAIGKGKGFKYGKPSFHGSFTKALPFPEAYEAKKLGGVSRYLKSNITGGLLSTGQVAAQLGIAVETVRNAIKRGLLPAQEVGTTGAMTRWLIRPGDVYKLRMRLGAMRRVKPQKKPPAVGNK